MRWVMALGFIISFAIASELESSYTEGNNFAKGLVATQDFAGKIKLEEVPGYDSKAPTPASNDLKNGDLSLDVRTSMENNEGSQAIVDSFNKKPKFIIDPNSDPLFNPRVTSLQDLAIEDNDPDYIEGGIEKTCEEGGDDIIHECFENRNVIVEVPVKTATLTVNHLQFTPTYQQETYVIKKGNFWRHTKYGTRQRHTGYSLRLPKEINAFKAVFCNGFRSVDCITQQLFNIDCKYIEKFKINSGNISDSGDCLIINTPVNSLNITLEHKTYEGEAIDSWVGCDSLEQMVEEGLCEYGERILTQGPETRNINGYPIFKDEWQYKQIYNCKMFKDECSSLRAQGCHQVNSRCKEWMNDKCWIYEQTYACPNGKFSRRQFHDPNLAAFCLTGNCHQQSYTANADMLDAIARLSLLKEVQTDLRANHHDPKIFKGDKYICRRDCLSFKDCCRRMKGWGVSLKFASCKAEEKQLAKMRQQSLCHQIGTYCAKKFLGKCIQKKTSFCCFGTKFARIIQEQGRSQLNLGWGDPKCPDCRSITIEELTKIDLSKINFSEVFIDLIHKYQKPNIKVLQEKVSDKVLDHMKNLQEDFNPKTKLNNGMIYDDHKDGL